MQIKRLTFSCLAALTAFTASAQGVTTEASEQNTPAGWKAVNLPSLPAITSANTFNIKDYGASESAADNAAAINKALQAVPSTGGMVVIPAGTYLSGPITIAKSKTILYLEKGATLKQTPYGTYPKHRHGVHHMRRERRHHRGCRQTDERH